MENHEVVDLLNRTSVFKWMDTLPPFVSLYSRGFSSIFRNQEKLEKYEEFLLFSTYAVVDTNFNNLDFKTFNNMLGKFLYEMNDIKDKLVNSKCDHLIMFIPKSYMDKFTIFNINYTSVKMPNGKNFMIAISTRDLDGLLKKEYSLPESLSDVYVRTLPRFYINARGSIAPIVEQSIVEQGNILVFSLPLTAMDGPFLIDILKKEHERIINTCQDDQQFSFTYMLMIVSADVLEELDGTDFFVMYNINKGKFKVIGLNYFELTF